MESDILRSKIENFSKLPETECAILLQNYLLEALEMEDPTYIELEMLIKFINIDYTLREPLRQLFNFALKRNAQRLAGVPINAWLKRYLDKYANVPRDIDTFFKHSTSDPGIAKLNEKDQLRLMRIFRIYDYLLVKSIISMDDPAAENLTRYPMYLSRSMAEIRKDMPGIGTESAPFSREISFKKSIREVLRELPAVGEQIVTSAPLKLKQFAQPVRPSIKNWLHDYTSHLGQERHSSMDRMRYLFGAENAKILSSQDRDKLAIILKSFDEDTSLPIDSGRQEVAFETIREQRSVNSDQPKKIEPKNDLFKRPYSPVSRMPNPAPTKAQPSIQSSTFPPPKADKLVSDKSSNSSRLNLPKIPQGQALAKPEKIVFTNPFPRPETHDMPDSNISNVRFTEHLPSQSYPKPEVSVQPKDAPTETPYKFTRPPQNMIYPHLRRGKERPEPKLDGNVVDLSGDKE